MRASTLERTAERLAQRARIARAKADAQRIVETRVCPDCGTRLRRNFAIAGWWECGARGSEAFRSPEHRNLPHCSFQCFTE